MPFGEGMSVEGECLQRRVFVESLSGAGGSVCEEVCLCRVVSVKGVCL